MTGIPPTSAVASPDLAAAIDGVADALPLLPKEVSAWSI